MLVGWVLKGLPCGQTYKEECAGCAEMQSRCDMDGEEASWRAQRAAATCAFYASLALAGGEHARAGDANQR